MGFEYIRGSKRSNGMIGRRTRRPQSTRSTTAALVLALCSLDCAHGGAANATTRQPSGDAPAASPQAAPAPPPPLPAAYDATFTQPIHLPARLVEAAIDAQLPEHESQPRRLLTQPNASPALEASLEVWRDPARVRVENTDAGAQLLVEVPLRYAAKFSARLKSPFGGKWLKVAENADWGTADAPERLTLRMRTRVEITRGWQLRLHTEIEPPQHGPAPRGKLCTGGSFKLCVSRDSLAPEVRRRIDAELVPRVRAELEKLDRRIEREVDLRTRAQHAWRGLFEPRPLGAHDRYRVLVPRQAALELGGEGDEIIVEPAVAGRVTFYQGKPPALTPVPLPERSPLAGLPGERRHDPRVFALGPLF